MRLTTKSNRLVASCLIASLGLLVACGTPQEQCINRVSKELRTVSELRAETAANITRGYAIDVSYVPYTTYDTCYYGNGRRYSCPRTYTRTVTQPRTIDVALEKRKLRDLEQKQLALEKQAAPYIEQCRVLYPENT